MAPFGETVGALHQKSGPFEIIIPAVPSVRPLIEQALPAWPQQPHLVEGESDKFTAFKLAHAALAASGTVTLELGVTGTPMVVAYRVDPVAARLRFLLKVHSVVLANLVLGANAFPEFIQEDCTPAKLSAALSPLLTDTPERGLKSRRSQQSARRCSCGKERRAARRRRSSFQFSTRKAAARAAA